MAKLRPIYLVDKIVHGLYKVIGDLYTHGSQQRLITAPSDLHKYKAAQEPGVSLFLSIYSLAGFLIPIKSQKEMK